MAPQVRRHLLVVPRQRKCVAYKLKAIPQRAGDCSLFVAAAEVPHQAAIACCEVKQQVGPKPQAELLKVLLLAVCGLDACDAGWEVQCV